MAPGQGVGREHVGRPAGAVPGDPRQDREVVAERLSRGRGGDDDGVHTRLDVLEDLRLVRVKAVQAAPRQRLTEAPRHRQQSMIVVPKDTPGVSFGRQPHVFGYEDRGGHPEVIYTDVRVPADNLLGEEGGGFAISQARLGPGRIHHCMRAIGVAERALECMIVRALQRTTFGTLVAHKGLIQDWIAEARIEIDMAL